MGHAESRSTTCCWCVSEFLLYRISGRTQASASRPSSPSRPLLPPLTSWQLLYPLCCIHTCTFPCLSPPSQFSQLNHNGPTDPCIFPESTMGQPLSQKKLFCVVGGRMETRPRNSTQTPVHAHVHMQNEKKSLGLLGLYVVYLVRCVKSEHWFTF